MLQGICPVVVCYIPEVLFAQDLDHLVVGQLIYDRWVDPGKDETSIDDIF